MKQISEILKNSNPVKGFKKRHGKKTKKQFEAWLYK